MPCYLLHLQREHLSVRDARGVECFDPAEVVETAVITALNRMSESHDFGRWRNWSVEIETGEHVTTVPFALLQTRFGLLQRGAAEAAEEYVVASLPRMRESRW
jgi:hypothetical protein